MKKQLSRFCHYWDEAALETLGSEFQIELPYARGQGQWPRGATLHSR